MTTSTIVSFRTAFASAISSQLSTDGVTGVTVNAYPQVDAGRGDLIVLGDVSAAQTHLDFGGDRDETYSLNGEVVAPKDGGHLSDATAAETRALAIFASIENTLRDDPTVSGSVFHAQIASYRSEVLIDERGYIGHIEFTIDVEAHI